MDDKELSQQEVQDRLAAALDRAGSARAFSVRHAFSHQYVSDVRAGRRAASPRLLAVIGVRRETRLVASEA